VDGARVVSAVTVDDVRVLALTLPRTTEHLIRDRVKFRVGRLVYLAFDRAETTLGFAFPKAERAALVAREPEKFLLPPPGDLRYNWAVVRLAAVGTEEVRELVLDAWTMVVPQFLVRQRLGGQAAYRSVSRSASSEL
jgi:hypothetical protein